MVRKKARVQPVEKIWLSTSDVATYLGVSREYVSKLRRSGVVPHCMIKNTAFFKKDDIDELVESHRVF